MLARHASAGAARTTFAPRTAGRILLLGALVATPVLLVPVAAGATGSAYTTPTIDAAMTRGGLDNPYKKNIAMKIVSSNENSTLAWKKQFAYIEDIHDGRGYTAGIIGFCSGTGDMLQLVEAYTRTEAGNPLARYLPALRRVNGTSSHKGLGPPFVNAWKAAAEDPVFRQAQDLERDRVYFNPAVNRAKADGLGTLGQFIYYDAIVMHGPGNGDKSFGGIRRSAMAHALTPARGGDETTYLNAFLDVRRRIMKEQRKHHNTSRIDTEQRVFLDQGNFSLDPTLIWHVYGDRYEIDPRSRRQPADNLRSRRSSERPRDGNEPHQPDRPAEGVGAGR
ncbi:MAG: chitosanase [Nocardioidaceae bacterium]|jgi:chitosanase|nr:chitosanase [Nocardioidaceae bacterium]